MKILIVRLSALGDIVHALPLASNAHRSGATVGWLTERAYGELLRGNPSIDRVFLADTRQWRHNPFSPAHLREMRALRQSLREFGPDATIDAQGLWKSAVLSRLARAPVVSFAARDRREPTSAILGDRAVSLARKVLHVVDENLSLLAALGLPVSERPPDARYLLQRPSPQAEAFLEKLPRPFALYHPGAGHPEKAWGEERYARLAERLQHEHGVVPVISWGPGDEKRLARMSRLLPRAAPLPRLGFSGLAHVIARSSLFVAGDTGPLHLADALDVPTLALFGPATPPRNTAERNGPYRGATLSYDEATAVEKVAARAVEIMSTQRAPVRRERNDPP